MSAVRSPYNMPPDKKEKLHRAKRLEWLTIFFLLTIIVAIGLTLGSSQAMKAVWVEDTLSLVPPIAFLIGMYYRDKPADERFPYGYRRAILIGFLSAALALFSFGLYILIDSVVKLIMAEHPTIQTVELFGRPVWLGWLMIAALIYSAIPPFVLGRMKLPLARELHEKALQTDADLNKADWLTGLAGVLGILGIGFGFWWADSVAAGIISFEIVRDGIGNLRNSVAQLMDKRPSAVDSKERDPVLDEVQHRLMELDWVSEASVRLREEGDILTGEAFVVPKDERGLVDRLAEASQLLRKVDWRIHELLIIPVRSLEEKQDGTEEQDADTHVRVRTRAARL